MDAAEELMRRVAEAFERADLRPLFDAIDGEKIVWKSGSVREGPFRFGGRYAKREGVVELTSQLAAAYRFRYFTPKEIVSKGDVVWGLFDVAGDFLANGDGAGEARPFRFECAIRWRLQNSRIVEHQTFFDTDDLFRQLNGVDAAVS
jgi:ketosteroid isomerase-like protein